MFVPSRARMRMAIDVEQMRRIDRGIDLRRTEASVAQQFLQRPQIRPAAKQMRSEGMAQRVGGGAVR